MLTLYIGNKNYSSWSMRPWVLMRQAGIAFDEVMVRFDSFSADSQFKQRLGPISPAGKVPVLVDDGFAVWDTLAIAEYLAEKFPDRGLWPADARARARARSICAEMHSGFQNLRGACMMNIEADQSAGWPAVERTLAGGFVGRCVVPLAEGGGLVAVIAEYLGDGGGSGRPMPGVAVPVVGKLGNLAKAQAVLVTPGEKSRARRRAHRRIVETVVGDTALRDAVQRWRMDRTAVSSRQRRPHVVQHDDQDVRRIRG